MASHMPAFLIKYSSRRNSPCISSQRPNVLGICGAPELHALEEFMVEPESVFWAKVFPSLGCQFPSSFLSYLDTHQLLVSM